MTQPLALVTPDPQFADLIQRMLKGLITVEQFSELVKLNIGLQNLNSANLLSLLLDALADELAEALIETIEDNRVQLQLDCITYQISECAGKSPIKWTLFDEFAKVSKFVAESHAANWSFLAPGRFSSLHHGMLKQYVNDWESILLNAARSKTPECNRFRTTYRVGKVCILREG